MQKLINEKEWSRLKYLIKKTPNQIKIKILSTVGKFLKSELGLGVGIFIVLLFIVTSFSYFCGDYGSEEFFENIRVEAHGMLMDVFIVAIVFAFIDIKYIRKNREIKKLTDELDLKKGSSNESDIRAKEKLIMRLIKLGKTNIDLSHCNLNCANLTGTGTGIDLSGSSFYFAKCKDANFTFADLRGASLVDGDFTSAVFNFANLSGCNFWSYGANFKNAGFVGANLSGNTLFYCDFRNANFTNANCSGARFTITEVPSGPRMRPAKIGNVDFTGTDLRGTMGIPHLIKIGQIPKSMKGAKLDPELHQYITQNHPNLL